MGLSFAAYLNLPPPVEAISYQEHMKCATDGAIVAAAASMIEAAREASESLESSDIRVSVDGTWQRRGFASQNGVVTVLSNLDANEANKVIDTQTLTTVCHMCSQRNNDNMKLSTMAKGHDCAVNHTGSAGGWKLLVPRLSSSAPKFYTTSGITSTWGMGIQKHSLPYLRLAYTDQMLPSANSNVRATSKRVRGAN